MIWYFSILYLVGLSNIYTIILSFRMKQKFYKYIFLILLVICLVKYFTILIFANAEAPTYLYSIKNLVYTSTIALPPLAFISINLIGKGFCNIIDKVFIIIITLIFFVIAYKAPQYVVNTDLGYRVSLGENWIYILSIIQCSFAALMIYLSFKFIFIAKAYLLKVLFFFFGLGYIVSILEALLLIFNNEIFQEIIISDGIIFISLVISLSLMQRTRD